MRYEVDLDLDKGGLPCNCSLCSKSRAGSAFAPAEGAEIRYRWTPPGRPKSNLTYHTCSTSGMRTHAEGMDPKGNAVVAVQVATREGADPDVRARAIRYVDGRHYRFDREPENTDAL